MRYARTLGSAAAVCAALWTHPASAAGGIDWLHSAAEGQARARRTGKPLLLDFYTDWCGWCKRLDRNTYGDAKVADYARRTFICVKVDGDKDKQTLGHFKVTGYPTTIICRADGEVLVEQGGYLGPDDFLKLLKKGARQFGPIRPPNAAKRIADTLNSARKALEQERPSQAMALFKSILREKGEWDEKAEARAGVERIESLAKDALAGAVAHVEAKRWAEAVKDLKLVNAQYAGAEAAAEARRKLRELRRDPAIGKLLREAEAAQLLAQAKAELAAGRAANALGQAEALVKSQAGTRAAEQAKQLAAAIRADEKLMAKISDDVARRQCRIWLNLAASFELNGRHERAKHYLELVVKTFPDSTYARQAQRKLRSRTGADG